MDSTSASSVVPDLGAETFVSGGGKSSLAHGQSFLSYMTTITESDKLQLMNLGQYILLAIVPITILLKLLKMFTPIEDPTKGSVELLVEVVAQLLVIVTAMYFIHKMIVYLIPSLTETFPDAIGLFLVRSTFLSKFLSTISFTMHPADLINIEPIKNRKE